VGFVQQGEKLLPWRTVLENVALGLELIGKSRKIALELSREALCNVGLSDYFDCFPRQISGGMAQRVLLARALAIEPEILFLDEPLGQLDLLARQELAAAIRSFVRRNNAACLLVTHSVEEAVFISDSVLTLSLRPARIREHFVLNDNPLASQGGGVLSRKDAFPIIQNALLHALTEIVK
jgi:ABC-type nitrate/sulfonate/bicarbonate transport system ATPase subunit